MDLNRILCSNNYMTMG